MKKITSARSLYPILIAVAALNSLSINPASAAPDLSYSGASTDRDSKDNIYKIGVGGAIDISDHCGTAAKTLTADACGWGKVSFVDLTSSTPTAITASVSSITVASLPRSL
jgi:hypothetical protein